MTCAEHAYRGRRRCPACAELVEARADATGCEWCIPGDAKMEDMRGLRCVLGDGHDGPHVVGVSGPGYVKPRERIALLPGRCSSCDGKWCETPTARARRLSDGRGCPFCGAPLEQRR